MKKIIIGILSGVVIFGSGMFMGKVNTVDKDTYEDLKLKHEQTIKETDKIKKDLSKINEELSELKKTDEKEVNQENSQNDKQTINKEVKQTYNSNEIIKESTNKNTVKTPSPSNNQESKHIETERETESKAESEAEIKPPAPRPTPMTPVKPSRPEPIENSATMQG